MYRRLICSVYRARNRAVEACVLPPKCDMPALAVYRVGGVKALSTSPINYCEKKDSLPPKQDGKSPTSMEGKVDNSEDKKVTEISQQVAVVGEVKSEAVGTIQQSDDIGTLEEQKSKESTTNEERLEVGLEEGKEGLGMVEVGVVQAEMDGIGTAEVQNSIESTSEVQKFKENTSEEAEVDVGVVQAEAESTIQHMDNIGTPEVQKIKESTSGERLGVGLEEDKERERMVDVGVVQADSTIQHMDDISTSDVQKSIKNTSEERLDVRLDKDTEGLEPKNTEHSENKSESSKSSKESLLDLLGDMKVDVTNKRKFKNTKPLQIYMPTPKDKPAAMESTESMIQKATDEASVQSDTLNLELVAAASAAAATLPNQSQAESELLRQLRRHEAVSEAQKKGEVNNLGKGKISPSKSSKESMLDLLGAMKVDVTSKRKFKNMKGLQTSIPTPKAKPAAMESTESMFQKATDEASVQSDTLNPELVAAASAAAATLPKQSQAESELLRQLRRHEAVSEAQKKGEVNNLGVIIADMKVGKGPNRQHARPANQIRFDDDGQGYIRDRGITAEQSGVRGRTMFSGKRLGIFSPTVDKEAETAIARPTLWDVDFTNQIVLSTNQSPRNALEEMIQWTREGKLWEYPINNEAGLEEEMSVPFHEHIFLEKHLVEGFPQQGPVRHFMELVVAGLVKNAHLTVQQKKDHISWFRDYFHQKEDVLKEADVYLN